MEWLGTPVLMHQYYLGLFVSGDDFRMGRNKGNPPDLYKVIPNPVLYNKYYLPILREYTALKSSFIEEASTLPSNFGQNLRGMFIAAPMT